MLRTPADVFHLESAKLLELERWGEKSVENLMRELAGDFAVPGWLAMRHAGDAGLLAWVHGEEDL